jgi:hypothetical protein
MPVLLPTAYLPPVSYISACIRAKQVMIEKQESYHKQTIRNHCNIYGPNGRQTLSIPVIRINGNHTLTKDIRISDSIPWQRLHWRSIETAYNNSPFFLYYRDVFEKVYQTHYDLLLDLNTELMMVIFKILRTKVEVLFTEKFERSVENRIDYRELSKIKPTTSTSHFPPYTQVFSLKHGFIPDLSIIDVIFNLGPESFDFLVSEINPTFVSV